MSKQEGAGSLTSILAHEEIMYWPDLRGYHLKIFPFSALVAMFSAELTVLINYGRGHHEEHFCEGRDDI